MLEEPRNNDSGGRGRQHEGASRRTVVATFKSIRKNTFHEARDGSRSVSSEWYRFVGADTRLQGNPSADDLMLLLVLLPYDEDVRSAAGAKFFSVFTLHVFRRTFSVLLPIF